jgi:hypothetical protein
MDHLRQRVRSSYIPKMGVVLHESQIFGVVPSNLYLVLCPVTFNQKNFIFHCVQETGTNSVDVTENRFYCVSFLSGNGWEDVIWNNKWIMGRT